MLAAENPYMLPAVLLGGAVYLGLSVLTDLSIVVRVGTLLGLTVVAPIGLNAIVRTIRGSSPSAADGESVESGDEHAPGEGSVSDEESVSDEGSVPVDEDGEEPN